jgi:hypothetical protein
MDEGTKNGENPMLPEDVTPGSWKTICPGCGASIPGKWITCPKCDYDFLEDAASMDSRDRREPGIAYSAFADLALLGGQALAFIGCVAAVIAGILLILKLNILGFCVAVLSFFQSFALYVVFTRVYHMKGKDRARFREG